MITLPWLIGDFGKWQTIVVARSEYNGVHSIDDRAIDKVYAGIGINMRDKSDGANVWCPRVVSRIVARSVSSGDRVIDFCERYRGFTVLFPRSTGGVVVTEIL